MDKEFTTTFIPKKPLVNPTTSRTSASRPLGIISALAFIIVIITALIAGGVFFYKQSLQAQVDDLLISLENAEKSFEPALLRELTVLDKKLRVADQLLKNQKITSPFFALIEQNTIPTVRFNTLNFSFEEDVPKVRMTGEAQGYQAIASQSQLFNETTFLKNIIFSNFILNQAGRVTFTLTMNLDPLLMSFDKIDLPFISAVQSSPLESARLENTEPVSTENSPVENQPVPSGTQ